ncbi:MAG: TolC family protein [Smithella sp.]
MILYLRFRQKFAFLFAAAICSFIIISTKIAWTDDLYPRQVTIVEAIQLALSNNHEIKAMQSSSSAYKQDIGIARSFLLPKISIEGRYLRTNNPGYAFMSRLNQERITSQDFDPETLNHPDAINDYQSSISIEQPVFAKKAFVGLSMSKIEAQQKDEEVKRKREEVSLEVIRAGLNISSAREYMNAARQGVKDAEEHLRVANLRYKNDLGQYSDSLRASTALTEARQKFNIAQKNVNLARRGLGLLLAMAEPLDVKNDSSDDIPLKELSFYTKNANARSDLRVFELREENARKNITKAEAGYFPYIGVGGTYQLNDHEKPLGSEGKSWQVMAFLRWEIFDGTKREYERAKAKHQASEAQEYLQAMKKGVSFKIYEAYMNVEEAGKNTELAGKALKTAEEGARLMMLRYENGLSSMSDLLSAQTSLEQARAGFVFHSNAYKLARFTLSFESGTILQDLKIE